MFHLDGRLIETMNDLALRKATVATELNIEARNVALNGSIAEDDKHLHLEALFDSLTGEQNYRSARRAT